MSCSPPVLRKNSPNPPLPRKQFHIPLNTSITPPPPILSGFYHNLQDQEKWRNQVPGFTGNKRYLVISFKILFDSLTIPTKKQNKPNQTTGEFEQYSTQFREEKKEEENQDFFVYRAL